MRRRVRRQTPADTEGQRGEGYLTNAIAIILTLALPTDSTDELVFFA